MMTLQELHKITEKSQNELAGKLAELLIQALNDWRSQVDSIEDYVQQLKKLLGLKELTKTILEQEMQRLKPETHSWELESISSLMEALKISGTEDMDSLLKQLSKRQVK